MVESRQLVPVGMPAKSEQGIYKLTEVDFMHNDFTQSEIDIKGKALPSAAYTEETPSIRSEQILSVRDRAESYFQSLASKEVSLGS